jgi:hypothetical protein
MVLSSRSTPPLIWPSAIIGLIIVPQSSATAKSRISTNPVSRSVEAARLSDQVVRPHRVPRSAAEPSVQGIGTAPYEEIPYDAAGQPLVGTLADYLMPGAAEMPAIKIDHLQTPLRIPNTA